MPVHSRDGSCSSPAEDVVQRYLARANLGRNQRQEGAPGCGLRWSYGSSVLAGCGAGEKAGSVASNLSQTLSDATKAAGEHVCDHDEHDTGSPETRPRRTPRRRPPQRRRSRRRTRSRRPTPSRRRRPRPPRRRPAPPPRPRPSPPPPRRPRAKINAAPAAAGAVVGAAVGGSTETTRPQGRDGHRDEELVRASPMTVFPAGPQACSAPPQRSQWSRSSPRFAVAGRRTEGQPPAHADSGPSLHTWPVDQVAGSAVSVVDKLVSDRPPPTTSREPTFPSGPRTLIQ